MKWAYKNKIPAMEGEYIGNSKVNVRLEEAVLKIRVVQQQ
jgi:hypothetical protein